MKTMITPCIAIANIVATDCTKIAILQPTGGPDLVELLAEKVKKKRIREKAVKRLMEKSPTETIEAQGLRLDCGDIKISSRIMCRITRRHNGACVSGMEEGRMVSCGQQKVGGQEDPIGRKLKEEPGKLQTLGDQYGLVIDGSSRWCSSAGIVRRKPWPM